MTPVDTLRGEALGVPTQTDHLAAVVKLLAERRSGFTSALDVGYNNGLRRATEYATAALSLALGQPVTTATEEAVAARATAIAAERQTATSGTDTTGT